nr:RNA polymerase alpha subunit [Ishige okamurae]
MTDFQFNCIEEDAKTPTDSFGRFVFKPLDVGDGVTIGNLLRRVLLSSLSGLRITAVRIANVNNEFASIEGVREDTLEILLNLKEIIFRSKNIESGWGRLKVQGPAVVTANSLDLPPEVELVNPFAHLLTISDDSIIELEVRLEWGKSYVLAEDQKIEGPSDLIPIDSNFMPVRKMNYYVKPLFSKDNVDEKKEQVFFDVWTNGTVTPKESIAQATDISLDWLTAIQKMLSSLSKEIQEENKMVPEFPPKQGKAKTPLEELNLSTRAYRSLKKADINFLEELVQYPIGDLKKIRNFGRKSLDEIMEKVSTLYNISLN